jgi:hypothetical protein
MVTVIIAGLAILLLIAVVFVIILGDVVAEYERQQQIEEAKQTAMRHIAYESWRAGQAMLGAVQRGWPR